MTKFSSLPNDIRYNIEIMVYQSIHYDNLKLVLDQLINTVGEILRKKYFAPSRDCIYPKMDDIIHLFYLLQNCRCCDIHMIHRPKKIFDYNYNYYEKKHMSLFLNQNRCRCKCMCRFSMKMINLYLISKVPNDFKYIMSGTFNIDLIDNYDFTNDIDKFIINKIDTIDKLFNYNFVNFEILVTKLGLSSSRAIIFLNKLDKYRYYLGYN